MQSVWPSRYHPACRQNPSWLRLTSPHANSHSTREATSRTNEVCRMRNNNRLKITVALDVHEHGNIIDRSCRLDQLRERLSREKVVEHTLDVVDAHLHSRSILLPQTEKLARDNNQIPEAPVEILFFGPGMQTLQHCEELLVEERTATEDAFENSAWEYVSTCPLEILVQCLPEQAPLWHQLLQRSEREGMMVVQSLHEIPKECPPAGRPRSNLDERQNELHEVLGVAINTALIGEVGRAHWMRPQAVLLACLHEGNGLLIESGIPQPVLHPRLQKSTQLVPGPPSKACEALRPSVIWVCGPTPDGKLFRGIQQQRGGFQPDVLVGFHVVQRHVKDALEQQE
mmetsp:Transcript_116973/g.376241  ORF Transcript_116973/g.376241 Transcript_116973/m.376241 type:complete len:342 (-) Transcript_116973:1228-2253(-)